MQSASSRVGLARRDGRGGGRVWRPNAEVADKFCGTWRYRGSKADQFDIVLNKRGALQFIDHSANTEQETVGLLEPGEKKCLQAGLADSDGWSVGTIRVRHNENHCSLQTQFRPEGVAEWADGRVAHNVLDPKPPRASVGELETLAQEVRRLHESAQRQRAQGDSTAALRSLEQVLALMRPRESLWEGSKKLATTEAGKALESLRVLQAEALLEEARCRLGVGLGASGPAGQMLEEAKPAKAETSRAAAQRALECCTLAEALREPTAQALCLRARALVTLERYAEAVAALAPAAIQEPEDSALHRELVRLRPLAGETGLLARAQELRRQGNDWVRSGQVEWGAHQYEEALAVLWGRPWPADEQLEERRKRGREQGRQGQQGQGQGQGTLGEEELQYQAEVALLTNLALCYLQGGSAESSWPPDPGHAICLCRMALDLDPSNTKAMLRKARGHSDLLQHEEAVMQLSYATELQPSDATIRRELSMAKKLAEDARKKARQWEKEAYQSMFDRIKPGFATPSQTIETSTSAASTWPADLFPTPLLRLGSAEVDDFANQLAWTLEADGEGPYTMELLHTIRYAVELEFGQGAAKGLARMVPFVHVMTCGSGTHCVYEIGKGQRRLSSRLEGLTPEQPFHPAEQHPWSVHLAHLAQQLATELQTGPQLWQVPWEGPRAGDGSGAPAWRSIGLVNQGAWVAGERFARARTLLSELQELRPYDVSFVRLPSQASLRHSANTNAVLTAHLPLELAEGGATVSAGEHEREWRVGEVLIFDPTYVHAVRNAGHSDALVLVCHFYHPDLHEVERYTLLFLEALIQRLQKTGLFSTASLSPSPGIDVQRALKYAA